MQLQSLLDAEGSKRTHMIELLESLGGSPFVSSFITCFESLFISLFVQLIISRFDGTGPKRKSFCIQGGPATVA